MTRLLILATPLCAIMGGTQNNNLTHPFDWVSICEMKCPSPTPQPSWDQSEVAQPVNERQQLPEKTGKREGGRVTKKSLRAAKMKLCLLVRQSTQPGPAPEGEEEWRDVEGYLGRYRVSNRGRVYSLTYLGGCGKFLKPRVSNKGYICVGLWDRDVTLKVCYVHRLVATAFNIKPEGCDVVNHLDSNRQNNLPENLEWTTYSGNVQHCIRVGRHRNGSPKYSPCTA